MAGRVKNADPEQTAAGQAAEHNAKDRAIIIQECAQSMRRIQDERATLNEDAGAIRERLKDAGIDAKSFMAALRLSDMKDGAARDTFLDGLREAASALGIGEQLDWVQEAEKQRAASAKQNGGGDDTDLRPEFLKRKEREMAEAEAAGTA